MKNVLIITAHPDDLEIACGGTVATLIRQGATVTNLILCYPRDDARGRTTDAVLAELAQSSNTLGFCYTLFPTACVDNRSVLNADANTISSIERSIDVREYDTIITHWREDWHQDHAACYNITNSLVRNKKINVLYFNEVPYNSAYTGWSSDYIVDTSLTLDQKVTAIKSYASYVDNSLISAIINHDKFNGAVRGLVAAETFKIGKLFHE